MTREEKIEILEDIIAGEIIHPLVRKEVGEWAIKALSQEPTVEKDPCETCGYAEGSPFCLQYYCPYDAERKKKQEPCESIHGSTYGGVSWGGTYKEQEPKMTLDEAIIHAEEVADSRCDECGREHNQLAEWLKELKAYKEQEPYQKDCRLCKEFDECENGKKGHENGTSIGYSIGECKDYEPCDDAVIRKAVLKRIAQFSTEEGSSVVCQPLYSDVNNMPSVTPSRQWIPVSERLPNKSQWVLVTNEDYQEPIEIMCYQGIRTGLHKVGNGEWEQYEYPSWTSGHGDIQSYHPKAWQPLPKPYEPEESEEQTE